MKKIIIILMFLIMGSLISGSAFAVDSTNLEACWSYDSTYNDLTANGWDLNNVGTTFLTGSNCKIGDCVEFTSGDRLTTGTLFNGFTSTSISFWMYSPSYSATYQAIINSYGSSNQNVVFQTQNADLNPVFLFSDGTTTTEMASGSITLSASTWYHIVITNSGNGVTNFYINGAYITSTGTAGSSGRILKTSTHDTWIGSIDGLSRSFVGRMDEFMIFEQTLSLSEIQELYNSNNALSCDDVLKSPTSTITIGEIRINNEPIVNNSFYNTTNINITPIINFTDTNNTNLAINLYVNGILNQSKSNKFLEAYNTNESAYDINFPYTNMFDNSYSTRAEIDTGVDAYTYINYTIHTGTTNSDVEIRAYYTGGLQTLNNSVSSSCLDNGDDILQLRIYQEDIGVNGGWNAYCYDGSSYTFIASDGTGDFNDIFEVKVYFDDVLVNNLIDDDYSFYLNDLVDSNYSFYFNVSNNETSVKSNTYTFTIDLTNPIINNSIPLEINSYEFSSDYFSCTDTNLLSCNISIDSLNKDSETDFTLTHNGNLSYTITAIDLAGNIATESGYVFVDPEFFVYFNNNTVNLENFTVNDISYEEYFTGTIYDYGLGVNNFTFKKTGYEEIEFQLNFTENYTNLNQTIFTSPVYINIQLKNILNGSEAPNNDYLIFISDESGTINTYQITNDNEITIENLYSQDTQIQISVVLNETLSNTFELVIARQSVSIDIYLNFQTTSSRIIEVKTSSLIAIPNIDVFLYKFIQGEGFVLETVKETNVLGQVFFNIIENTAIYNVCAVYQEEEACLSQVTFQNAETDPYEIIFSTEYKVIERDYLDFISWSFSEDKNFTTETSQMTYTFQDTQAIVEKFCYEVYRTTNTIETYLGEFCNENSAGQVVQTFTLEENQKLTYIFNFYIAGDKKILNTYVSYGENALLNELIDNSIIDIIFLVLIFGLISLSLSFNNFTFYNLSFLGGSIVILIIQAYINQNYMTSLIWTFLFLKTLVLYMTKVEK